MCTCTACAMCYVCNVLCVCVQVHIPTELHSAGAVGHRLRDTGGYDSPDHPSEQEPVSGPHRWVPGEIVSTGEGEGDEYFSLHCTCIHVCGPAVLPWYMYM